MVSMRVASALEHASEPAGLAFEMEAQRELVHVLEGEHREPAHRIHRDLGEQAVARLGEQRHHDAHAAIGRGHRERHRHHPTPGRLVGLVDERVGRPFEGEGHRDGGELGREQQPERKQHPRLEVGPVRRPYVRPQVIERAPKRPPSAETSRFICSAVLGKSLITGPYPTDRSAVNRLSYRQFRARIHLFAAAKPEMCAPHGTVARHHRRPRVDAGAAAMPNDLQ